MAPTTMSNGVEESDGITLDLFRCLQLIVALAGIVGNTMVLIVIYRAHDYFKNQTNFLIGNQSAADLFSALQLILFQFEYFARLTPPSPNTVWSVLYCFFWQQRLLLFGSYAISTFNLTILSLERYFAVVHPQLYIAKTRKKLFSVLGISTWFLGPVMQITFIAAHVYYKDGTCNVEPTTPLIGVFIFLWDYFIPVSIMTFCFVEVSLKLRTLRRVQENWSADTTVLPSTSKITDVDREGVSTHGSYRDSQGAGSSKVEQGNNLHIPVTATETSRFNSTTVVTTTAASGQNSARSVQRKNATFTILIVYLAYVICWTPNQFGFLQYNLGGTLDWLGLFYRIELIMASSNSFINVIIYTWRFKTFKTGIKKLFKCM